MEKFENIQKLAKLLNGTQLIETEDLKAIVTDIANAFAQHRASFKELTKEQKDNLNLALRQLNDEHDRILSELEKVKLESKSEVTESIKKALYECKSMCDLYKEETLNEVPITQEIVEEVLSQLPEQKETILDDGNQIVSKINSDNTTSKIKSSQVEGLEKMVTGKDLDRAISILDQRSQYLINRTVKHDATLSGSGTDADPLTVVGGGAGYTILTTASTVDDSNVTFVFSSTPALVVVNGLTYRSGSTAMGGTVVISGTNVTLPSPVGTGGDIYALG